ncbi:MAG: SpoIIE family protein phosphatase [Kiritimatiellae bacterium]|nr:SpoIIE family protein phosphatase [Kiritimatiellia bacterium]
MKGATQRRLAVRLVGAVAIAFAASLALTWMLHERLTRRDIFRLIDNVFSDVAVDIRERVDARMFRQAMAVRDKVYEMQEQPWWSDPDESSRRLRALADELGVDEICIADADGMLSHSARRDEVGALNFVTAEGQAHEFASLLNEGFELSQPLLPNSLRGEMVKYVGVWMPEGGFVLVGAQEKAMRNLARSALTGLTHGWHVSGDEGGIFITTDNGTIISHPIAGQEGGQWRDPGAECYWEKRVLEGFPVYVVIPKRTAVVERRVLIATSAFLNGMALVLASILVGLVIARYVRDQLAAQHRNDMDMAKSIQESAIPRVFPPFPEESRMDIVATMLAAREIGGDFYDFYLLGSNRLMFLVADVSGKGVPAALYMMRAKTTIKGIAQTGLPLDEVAERANEALSHDNDANMFVTAWLGELNMSTGVVTFVNAGHNPPIRIASDAAPSFIRERSGLMLGAMEGMKYKAHELTLRPGDAIYLYTDGITEQPNERGELFGEEMLRFSIETMLAKGVSMLDGGRSPMLSAIFRAVIAHGGLVEQADDCTQLVVRYNGGGVREDAPDVRRASRSFPSSQEGVASASGFLDGVLATEGEAIEMLSPKLHIILDEIASNIAKHSGASSFDIEIVCSPGGVKLTFSDDGAAYDPLMHSDPDVSLPAEERPIGGLGILMVKKMATDILYRREGGRNVLAVALASPRRDMI